MSLPMEAEKPVEDGKKKLGRPFGAKTGCVAQRISQGLGRGRGRGRVNKLIRSSILHQRHADLRMKMLNRGKEFPEEEEEEPSGGQGNCEEREDEEGRVKVFVPENRSIRLTEINPFITCQLCCGYLINAVTIVECLHTFCHSCIVKHFYVHLKCPACDILVHPTNPMANVKYDQLKQEIVTKLLPNLLKEEEERERNFYISKGLPVPQKKDLTKTNEPTSEEKKKVRPKERHRLVSLVLEFEGCGAGVERCRPLSKRFIRVTSNATVQNVQHFIRKKHNLSDTCQIKVCCDMFELNEELSLEYIRQTIFDGQECIIPLQYRFEKRVIEDKPFYTSRTSDTEDKFL